MDTTEPEDETPSTLRTTLEYLKMSPEERGDFDWDEDLGMYYQKANRDKFLWSVSDLEPIS